jgi:ribonuclease P protein component
MAAPSWPAAVRAAGTNSPSATRKRTNRFPKNARILRSSDFRKVYDGGTRFSGPLFAAFCLLQPEIAGPRIGFTVPRALGPAVTRNRIKRRFREAVRHRLDQLSAPWSIVINPRRSSIECPFPDLEREIVKLFARCSKQDSGRP